MSAFIVPIGSKNGIVVLGTADVFGEEWGANLTIENDEYKHFDQTAGADGNSWAQIVTGFAKGDGTCRAKYDATPGADLPVTKGIWMGATGVGYFGYTTLIGFIIAYTIVNVRPASNTANPGSSMFDFDLKITDCEFTDTGP